MKNKRVVLVGGAGFIGTHLAVAFARAGAAVTVIDNLMVNNLLLFAAGWKEYPQRDLYMRFLNMRLDKFRAAGIQLYTMDARQYHPLSHILSIIKPQIIIHLAAVAHAGKSNKDPYSTFDHSLHTLENTLDYARGNSVEQFVFFSSSMGYGDFQKEEVGEDEPLNPKGIYGSLKVAGELLVKAYNQICELPYTIVRPSALYGPLCVSRRVVQVFIEQVLSGNSLVIQGDGSDKLDFTYIDDLVQGILLVLSSPVALCQTFNLTFGQARSIEDLAKIICRHFPHAIISSSGEKRDSLMPERGTLSITKARSLLGYEPQYPLERGVDKLVEWYKNMRISDFDRGN